MFLFELTSCCDEGYDGAEDLFQGNSKLDVAKFILKEIQIFIKDNEADILTFYSKRWSQQVSSSKGFRYYCILKRIRIENPNYDSRSEFNSDKLWVERLKTMTPQKLLDVFDESSVDGDSYFQVMIHQYDTNTIISV